MFYNLISVLVLIVCLLLVLVVLVQNSKGGGLASNFSSVGQTMGVRQQANVLEKSTWTLAIVLGVLSIVATAAMTHQDAVQNRSLIEMQLQRTTAGAMPIALPDADAPVAGEDEGAEQAIPVGENMSSQDMPQGTEQSSNE